MTLDLDALEALEKKLREHEESADCWCRPRVEEDGCAVFHNSLDGRELVERGERLIQ